MVREIVFDEIKVGETFGPIEFLVDEETVKQYCDDHDDHNPIYLVDSPFGGPVVPPALKASLQCQHAMDTKYDLHATVPTRSEHEYLHPAKVGSRLMTSTRLTAKYIKRGLEYIVLESQTVDQNGVKIRHSLEHILLSLQRRHGEVTQGYDSVKDYLFQKGAAPKSQLITARGNLAVGREIPPLTKIAYQRALHEQTFLTDSIHDDNYARSHGYAGALVSGYTLNEYMSQMLIDFFGPNWLRGGVISQDFIDGGVQEGDKITCRARIVRMVEEGTSLRLDLDIWMEKSREVKVLVGQASGMMSA